MSLENSPSDGAPTTTCPLVIPPLDERGTPSSARVRGPVFTRDLSHPSLRSQPTPPVEPPPNLAFGSSGRSPPDLLDALGLRLPQISPRPHSPDVHKSPSAASLLIIASREKLEVAMKAEEDETTQARERINEITKRPAQSASILNALAKAHESVEIIQELQRLTKISKDVTASKERQLAGSDLPTEGEPFAQNGTAARKLAEETIEGIVDYSEQREEIRQILTKVENRTKERQRAQAQLKAEEIARDLAKAKRMVDIRNLAKEVARVGETDGNTVPDEAEREEIGRALAAVDETRRKRMKRQQEENGAMQQDEEKLRRRQVKREQLMKKRKDMEERLEEEASKMAQLTESAKKKGENKFMSEEAKRDAEERIRAEAEVVVQLERQAAHMAEQRASMQRQLAEREGQKIAEIEASSTALKAKRAVVEARMRQEQDELKTLSESAKHEVESKMAAEAAAIAEMERQALQLSTKRTELEAQISNRLHLEHTLVQESQKLTDKREAMEAKMRQEEEELQKLSDEAKSRVMEKMAAEAAAIAEMERQAGHLVIEREALASQIAAQRAELVPVDEQVLETPSNTRTTKISKNVIYYGEGGGTHCHDGAMAQRVESVGEVRKMTPDSHTNDAPSRLSSAPEEMAGASVVVDRTLRFAPNAVPGYELSSYERQAVSSELLYDPFARQQNHAPEQGQDPSPEQILGPKVCTHCRTDQGVMSPAHLAAAAGHVVCLEEIQLTCPVSLAKLDSPGRSPLFYACANAHSDAVDLLVREGPQCCHLMDANGDTPLHAASLAGSALCCRLLLQRGNVEVEPYNTVQMTPAHLAANNDVLEVLSQHGANLNAKDADLRTPLFVACATDRLEKAEFLCELLECAGQDLGETDKRGDTPMHAAACNGSTACLLLLLQYGVAPDLRNSKGLRPIDLASRKGQSTCEKILMEYQLHHRVNNSYFDSVLFLATLEGHKKCKETLTKQEQVESINSPTSLDNPLSRPESMWSLNRGRSVRLKHWGDWIAYEDQNARSVFWYNHVAKTSQWETPLTVRETSMKHATNSSMRLKRDGDWIEYTLPDGNVFYYNENTNDFQWQRPDQLSPRGESEERTDEGGLENDTAETLVTGAGDWGAFQDPSTGLVFWYNQITGESQWDRPKDTTTENWARNGDGNLPDMPDMFTQDEIVREVTSVDELFTPR